MSGPIISKEAVLVTGVSSGIGEAIAENLLASGYHVFGSVRELADAASLVQFGKQNFTPLVFDVSDDDAIQRSVSLVESVIGTRCLKALINNAGVSFSGPLALQPAEDIRQTFEINVFGTLNVTRAFLPLLGMDSNRRQESSTRIVNISSVSGAITVPFMGAYSASKHAVEAITQALRRELKPYSIDVCAIEPGFIRTKMFDKAIEGKSLEQFAGTYYSVPWKAFNKGLLALERKAKPTEVVTKAVKHAIESRKPRTRYPLDAIWTMGRVLPDRVFDRLIFKAVGIAHLMRPKQ